MNRCFRRGSLSLTPFFDLFTGQENRTTSKTIDRSLALTQVAMEVIDSVKVVSSDTTGQDDKSRTLLMATFGTASAPMTAAALFLMFQFAIPLVVGLGPFFILCLIFDQTKELFRRWLLYGIGTVFAMAMLSAMSIIVLDLTIRVGAAMWLNTAMNAAGWLGSNPEGLTSQAMQSGAIGLLLTLLLISVPPMAAIFFQGTLGSFMHFSAWQNSSTQGPQGQPPGSYAGRSHAQPVALTKSDGRSSNIYNGTYGASGSAFNTPQTSDEIRKV